MLFMLKFHTLVLIQPLICFSPKEEEMGFGPIYKTLRAVAKTQSIQRTVFNWIFTVGCLVSVGFIVQRSREAHPWSVADFMDGVWTVEKFGDGCLYTLNITEGFGFLDLEDEPDAFRIHETSPQTGTLHALGLTVPYEMSDVHQGSQLRFSSGPDHHWTLQEPLSFVLSLRGKMSLVGRRRSERNHASFQDKFWHLVSLVFIIPSVIIIRRSFRQDRQE